MPLSQISKTASNFSDAAENAQKARRAARREHLDAVHCTAGYARQLRPAARCAPHQPRAHLHARAHPQEARGATQLPNAAPALCYAAHPHLHAPRPALRDRRTQKRASLRPHRPRDAIVLVLSELISARRRPWTAQDIIVTRYAALPAKSRVRCNVLCAPIARDTVWRIARRATPTPDSAFYSARRAPPTPPRKPEDKCTNVPEPPLVTPRAPRIYAWSVRKMRTRASSRLAATSVSDRAPVHLRRASETCAVPVWSSYGGVNRVARFAVCQYLTSLAPMSAGR
ncbi:hypothetical protein BC834DRAFT_344228 [Gloeopeniophorella convolvens]|nr:hypothetical protein BC834DRAFT_344228 [Gloeopeniophorella convolvens]